MKIAPISAPAPTASGAGESRQIPSVRSLRMSVNRTPGADLLESEAALTIPDPSKETSAATEVTEPLSPQAAALAKQRRALQVKERELDDRLKAFEAKSSGSDFIPKQKFIDDPLGVLLENGVTYERLTEAILSNQGSSELTALKAELKAQEERFEKKLTDRDTQTKQQVLAEMSREAIQLVREGDEFELVRESGRVKDAITLIDRTHAETGEVMDVREALRLVEEELIKDAEKLARLSKVQSRISPPLAPQQQQQSRPIRTLTNRDTAQAPLSRKARAMAAFNGQLK